MTEHGTIRVGRIRIRRQWPVKPSAEHIDGWTGPLVFVGTCDEDVGARYVGETMWMPVHSRAWGPNGPTWVASGDVEWEPDEQQEAKPMTDEELKAIEARAKAATEGPWRAWPEGTIDIIREAPSPGATATIQGASWEPQALANGAFIAAARSDVPALVAEMRRLREQVAGLEKRDRDNGAIMKEQDEQLAALRRELGWKRRTP